MRVFLKLGLVVGLAVMTSGIADAQFGGFGRTRRGGGGGSSALDLLRMKEVRNELKFTEAQQKKIPGSVMKALKDIMETSQYTRLEQLVLQRRGSAALRDPEIQKKLKFSTAQTEDLATLYSDYEKASKALFSGGKGGKGGKGRFDRGAFTRLRAMRKEIDEKTMKVLSKSQMKAWLAMTGPKFDFPTFGFGKGGKGSFGKGGKGRFGKGKGGKKGRPGGGRPGGEISLPSRIGGDISFRRQIGR